MTELEVIIRGRIDTSKPFAILEHVDIDAYVGYYEVDGNIIVVSYLRDKLPEFQCSVITKEEALEDIKTLITYDPDNDENGGSMFVMGTVGKHIDFTGKYRNKYEDVCEGYQNDKY